MGIFIKKFYFEVMIKFTKTDCDIHYSMKCGPDFDIVALLIK